MACASKTLLHGSREHHTRRPHSGRSAPAWGKGVVVTVARRCILIVGVCIVPSCTQDTDGASPDPVWKAPDGDTAAPHADTGMVPNDDHEALIFFEIRVEDWGMVGAVGEDGSFHWGGTSVNLPTPLHVVMTVAPGAWEARVYSKDLQACAKGPLTQLDAGSVLEWVVLSLPGDANPDTLSCDAE